MLLTHFLTTSFCLYFLACKDEEFRNNVVQYNDRDLRTSSRYHLPKHDYDQQIDQ